MQHRTIWRVAAVLSAFAAISVAGCGGGSATVSSASLAPRLLPSSLAPGYFLERTLDWRDPVDLVGEGIFLPQITHPSQAVKLIRADGFEGASGEQFTQGAGGPELLTGVVKFSSAADAQKVRDWMHNEDLQQPCFSACIFSPQNYVVAGVRGARAVRQVAHPPAPPSRPPGPPRRRAVIVSPVGIGAPPTRFLVEFTVGRYLYFASTAAPSPAVSRIAAGTRQYYERVKRFRGG
jgi:hypothetical protein